MSRLLVFLILSCFFIFAGSAQAQQIWQCKKCGHQVTGASPPRNCPNCQKDSNLIGLIVGGIILVIAAITGLVKWLSTMNWKVRRKKRRRKDLFDDDPPRRRRSRDEDMPRRRKESNVEEGPPRRRSENGAPIELVQEDRPGRRRDSTPPTEEVPVCDKIETVDDEDDSTAYGLNAEDAKMADRLPGGEPGKADISGGLGILSLGPQPHSVKCLALHADHRLGLAGCGPTIFVLDLNEGKRNFRFAKHRAAVTCLAISPDGRQVLSGDEKGRMLLWDLNSRSAVQWLEGHEDAVRSVAFSSGGQFAASGGDDCVTRLWDLETGKEQKLEQERWRDPVNCVAFSPDGRQVLGAGEKVRAWNVKNGSLRVRFKGDCEVTSAAYSYDGSEVAACAASSYSSTGLEVLRWDADTGKPLPCFKDPVKTASTVSLAAVAPGSLRVISMGKKGRENIKSDIGASGSGSGLGALLGASLAANALSGALDSGGDGFCVVYVDASEGGFDPSDPFGMQIWGLVTGSAKSFDAGTEKAVALAISDDGTRALSISKSNIIQYWGLPR